MNEFSLAAAWNCMVLRETQVASIFAESLVPLSTVKMMHHQMNSVCVGTRNQKRKVLEREERAAGKAEAPEASPAANHGVGTLLTVFLA